MVIAISEEHIAVIRELAASMADRKNRRRKRLSGEEKAELSRAILTMLAKEGRPLQRAEICERLKSISDANEQQIAFLLVRLRIKGLIVDAQVIGGFNRRAWAIRQLRKEGTTNATTTGVN